MNASPIIKYPFRHMTSQIPNAVYACINFGEVDCLRKIKNQSILIFFRYRQDFVKNKKAVNFYFRSQFFIIRRTTNSNPPIGEVRSIHFIPTPKCKTDFNCFFRNFDLMCFDLVQIISIL